MSRWGRPFVWLSLTIAQVTCKSWLQTLPHLSKSSTSILVYGSHLYWTDQPGKASSPQGHVQQRADVLWKHRGKCAARKAWTTSSSTAACTSVPLDGEPSEPGLDLSVTSGPTQTALSSEVMVIFEYEGWAVRCRTAPGTTVSIPPPMWSVMMQSYM